MVSTYMPERKFLACWLNCNGCKHSEVDQTNAPVYKINGFFGQRPINNIKKFL